MDNKSVQLLSNIEVFETVKLRKKLHGGLLQSGRKNEGIAAVTEESKEVEWVLDNVEKALEPKASQQSIETVSQFVKEFQEKYPDVEQFELFQLVNLSPVISSVVYTIIESCDIRFTEDQVAGMIGLVKKYLISSP